MKTYFSSLVLLALGVLTHAPLSAAAPVSNAVAYRVSSIEKYGVRSIVAGDTLSFVKSYLGNPDQKLSDNIWVYLNFNPSHQQAKQDDCSIVLITFVEGRIAEIQGLNASALKVMAARLGERTQVAKVK